MEIILIVLVCFIVAVAIGTVTALARKQEAVDELDQGGLGSLPVMTMNQQTKDALTQNWEQVKTQIQAQFPDVDEQTLSQAQSSPDRLPQMIADATGQDVTQVEQQLQSVAQQFQGGQGQSS